MFNIVNRYSMPQNISFLKFPYFGEGGGNPEELPPSDATAARLNTA